MPMGWVAAASVAGSLLSSEASKNAAGSQSAAAKEAAATNQAMFERLQSQSGPYRQAGYQALSQIARGFGQKDPMGGDDPAIALWNQQRLATGGRELAPEELNLPDVIRQLGFIRASWTPGSNVAGDVPDHPETVGSIIPFNQDNADFLKKFNEQRAAGGGTGAGGIGQGQFTHQFNADDLNANLAPNWEFALKQGQGAVANAANATGGMGGNYGKGLIDYTIGKAGDLYQQAFQNYAANQTNIYNRLASVAGLGQTANAQAGVAGVSLAGNVGNAQMAAGQAQAAGQVGSANALGSGATNAASWYALPQIMNQNRTQNYGYDPNFASDAGRSMSESG